MFFVEEPFAIGTAVPCIVCRCNNNYNNNSGNHNNIDVWCGVCDCCFIFASGVMASQIGMVVRLFYAFCICIFNKISNVVICEFYDECDAAFPSTTMCCNNNSCN